MPQNHPRPKAAVSNTAGAAASMGGIAGLSVSILYARFIFASVVLVSLLACESIAGVQAHSNDSILKKNKHHMPVVQLILYIVSPSLLPLARLYAKVGVYQLEATQRVSI
jgi:hypothetical protein